jgi:hypothetical protein
MRGNLNVWIAAALLLAPMAVAPAAAQALDDRFAPQLLKPYAPAVSMETDRRLPRSRRGDARFGATGIVRCGNAVGTAQLTLKNDVITTAAHVLIGNDGHPRAPACTFEPTMGLASHAVAIDMRSIRAGSRTPLSEPAVRDWAVARLTAPIHGAVPYGLAAAGATPAGVVMCAGGNGNPDAMATERCAVRRWLATAPDGIREFAIDCSAAPGSSGGALIVGQDVAGIYVGFRSASPQQAQTFSDTHYNFAITVDGPFRRAVHAIATGQ